MKKIHFLFYFILFLFLGACSTKYSTGRNNLEQSVKLEKGSKVLIIIPNDGAYNEKEYKGTGEWLAQQFRINLANKSSHIGIYDNSQPNNDVFQSARSQDFRYIIKPTILNWEPRSAAWSGRSTRVEFFIEIFDLNKSTSDTSIIQKAISVKGRNVSFTNQDPKDIAKTLLERFITDLY